MSVNNDEAQYLDDLLADLDSNLETVFKSWPTASRCPPQAANRNGKPVCSSRGSPSPTGSGEAQYAHQKAEIFRHDGLEQTSHPPPAPPTPSTLSEISDRDLAALSIPGTPTAASTMSAGMANDEYHDSAEEDLDEFILGDAVLPGASSQTPSVSTGTPEPPSALRGKDPTAGDNADPRCCPARPRRVSWDPRITGGCGVFKPFNIGALCSSGNAHHDANGPAGDGYGTEDMDALELVQGLWLTSRNRRVEIKENRAYWASGCHGNLRKAEPSEPNCLLLKFPGAEGEYRAKLNLEPPQQGTLTWDDGDVWYRLNKKRPKNQRRLEAWTDKRKESQEGFASSSSSQCCSRTCGVELRPRFHSLKKKLNNSDLDGEWINPRQPFGPPVQITFKDGEAHWPSGDVAQVNVDFEPGKIQLAFQNGRADRIYQAVLTQDQKMVWNDGDVWFRKEMYEAMQQIRALTLPEESVSTD